MVKPCTPGSVACAALALAVLLGACDQPTDPKPSLPSLTGTYALTHIGDQPLPAQYYYSQEYDTRSDYVEGTLVLGQDSTFSAAYTIRYTKGTLGGRVQPGSEYGYRLSGTYSVRPDTILYRFRTDNSPELLARLEIVDPHTLVAPTNGFPRATFRKQ